MTEIERHWAAAMHAAGWTSNGWGDIEDAMLATCDACDGDAYHASRVALSTMLQTAPCREQGLRAAKRAQLASGILDTPGGCETWEAWVMIHACARAAENRWAVTLSEGSS